MRKKKRKLRLNRVFGVILSVCMIAGDVSISLTQSWATTNASATLEESNIIEKSDDTSTETTTVDPSSVTPTEKTTETPSPTTEGGAAEQQQETTPAGVLNSSTTLAEQVNAAFDGNATYEKSDGANKITLNKSVTLAQTVQIAVNLSIDLNGHTVTAPAGSDAFKIIGDDLKVTFDSSKAGAQINGGDGVDGKAGADGTAGGAGINAGEHKVDLTIGKNVKVKGGDGGSSKEVNSDGKGFGNGGRGGDGVIVNSSDSNLTIDGTIIGGNGGNGFTGWEANNGGDGGNGVTLAVDKEVFNSGETASVTGGNGGIAGNGGTYGKGGKAFSQTVDNALITQKDGEDGYILVASGNVNYGNSSEDNYAVNINMSAVLEELLEQYGDEIRKPGNTVKVDLDVTRVSGEPNKAEALDVLNLDTVSADTIGAYFDISLSLIVKNSSGQTEINQTIDATNNSVTITLAVPAELQGGTNYTIIRVHKYTDTNKTVAKVLPTQASDGGKTVTFTTDLFSTYILAYTPATSGGSGNGNGDGNGNGGSGNGGSGNGNGSGSGSGSEGGSGNGSGSGSEGGSGSGSEGGSGSGSGAGSSGSATGSTGSSSAGGSGSSAAVATGNGSGTNGASNTAYVSTSSIGASNGKDAEPKTGDMRQSKALIFVHLGTAAACLYLIAIAVEAKLNRRRKRA